MGGGGGFSSSLGKIVASKQLRVDPNERRFISGVGLGGYFVYNTILFGIGSGPLAWDRVAALAMRSTHAMLKEGEAFLQCYVDDPVVAMLGSDEQRRRTALTIILRWQALGLRHSWRNGKMGTTVDWIGATITVNNVGQPVVVSLLESKRAELLAQIGNLMQETGTVPMAEVRMLACRGSCLGGLLPHVRPCVRMLWGSLVKPATRGTDRI